MNLELAVCVQFGRCEKFQNHIKVEISYVTGY